jgi:hypothetical protein
MLVGEEDMPEGAQGNVGEDELTRDTVAAVDDVRDPVRDDDLGRP